MTEMHAEHRFALPPVNISLIDDSGAFKEQAQATRRYFQDKERRDSKRQKRRQEHK